MLIARSGTPGTAGLPSHAQVDSGPRSTGTVAAGDHISLAGVKAHGRSMLQRSEASIEEAKLLYAQSKRETNPQRRKLLELKATQALRLGKQQRQVALTDAQTSRILRLNGQTG